jgi:hypothetical protein
MQSSFLPHLQCSLPSCCTCHAVLHASHTPARHAPCCACHACCLPRHVTGSLSLTGWLVIYGLAGGLAVSWPFAAAFLWPERGWRWVMEAVCRCWVGSPRAGRRPRVTCQRCILATAGGALPSKLGRVKMTCASRSAVTCLQGAGNLAPCGDACICLLSFKSPLGYTHTDTPMQQSGSCFMVLAVDLTPL